MAVVMLKPRREPSKIQDMTTTTTDIPLSEAEIFAEIFGVHDDDLDPAAARGFLSIKVKKRTQTRVSRLLDKNSRGTISAPEKIELDRYIRIATFLDLLHSKARLSLKRLGEESRP